MKTLCKMALGGALIVGASFGTPSAQAQPPMAGLKAAGMELKPVLDANLDKMFMMHAAAGNMAEVMMGQLALKKSRNPGVRTVAKTIIAGHSAAQKKLAMVFKDKGMMLPPDAGPTNKAVYKTLSTLKGAAFDKAFMGGQVEAHENTIVLFEHEIMAGQDPRPKAFATNELPGIVGHTALIYDAAAKVSAPGIKLRPPVVLKTAMDANMKMMGKM